MTLTLTEVYSTNPQPAMLYSLLALLVVDVGKQIGLTKPPLKSAEPSSSRRAMSLYNLFVVYNGCLICLFTSISWALRSVRSFCVTKSKDVKISFAC